MSHFTKNSKVFITDLDAFVKTLRELGIKGQVSMDTTIKAFDGKKHEVALAVNCGNYSIGLEQEEQGRYSMVGDWWGIKQGLPSNLRDLNDDDLQNTILQNTTKNTIKDKYESQGFDVSVVENKAGDMQLTLTRSGGRFS